jgi:hypothetical protein
MCERPRSHHLYLNLKRKDWSRCKTRMMARVGKLARLDRQEGLPCLEGIQGIFVRRMIKPKTRQSRPERSSFARMESVDQRLFVRWQAPSGAGPSDWNGWGFDHMLRFYNLPHSRRDFWCGSS